jgi:hypothetical protein
VTVRADDIALGNLIFELLTTAVVIGRLLGWCS